MRDLFKNDRELSVGEIKAARSHYVVTHNDLITRASYDLTAKELKIMDFVISKIRPTDEDFDIVHTSLYELNNIFGLSRSGKTYSDMVKSIGTLRKKEVLIYDENDETVVQTGWVQSAKYEKTGKVEIRLSRELTPYLLKLKKDYTQYKLFDTVQLDSKYSIRLYKIMREADKKRGKETPYIRVTSKKLAEMLGAPKSYSFGDFNRNVLKPAIDEINLKIDDMVLFVNQFKRGRRVEEIEIYNNFYPIETVALPDDFEHVPMDIDKYE